MAALTSITGLQNLTNIIQFHADYNSLTSIDFSGMSSLTLIDISDNEVPGDSTHSLTSVNLSGCTSLETLRIDDSEFSAGFPDLSDCTSLQWLDADDSYLSGSVDISNAPALRGFDFSQNSDVTEIIISKDQPLGDGEEVNINACTSLTQTSLDNILQQLSSGSVNGGYINFSNTVAPSLNVGLPALRNLVDDKGWTYDTIANYNVRLDNVTDVYPTAQEACDAAANNWLETRYIYIGTNVEVENRIFTDENLVFPLADGYFALLGDGAWTYQVSNGDGTIIAQAPCGV